MRSPASFPDVWRTLPARLERSWMMLSRHGAAFFRHATALRVFNLLRLHAEMAARRTVVSSFPCEVILDITNRCNLRCPLCPTGQRQNLRPFGDMPFDRFKGLVDELAPYLFKARLHSWGDPLLHERFHDMVALLRDADVATEVSTNLTLLTEKDARRMVTSGLELLIVSADGTTEETYRRYRQGGSLTKVRKNLEMLVRARREAGVSRPVIEVQFLMMRHNVHQKEDIVTQSLAWGADRCRVFPVAVNVRDPAQQEAWLPEDPRLTRYTPGDFRDRYFAFRRVCPWPWRSAVINWDGTVSPCCVYEGPKSELGEDVFRDGFRAVWNGPAYRAARQTFRGRGQAVEPGFNICRTCRGHPEALDLKQQGLY